MLKKLLSLVLAILMVTSMLVACKPDAPADSSDPDEPSTPGDAGATDRPDGPSNPTTSVEPGTTFGTGAVLGEVKYYEKDVVVANIVATDEPYNADPKGETDSTDAIQQALYDVDEMGGGVVFLPAGDYLVTRTLFVPSGCVLQGDWQDPDEVEATKAEYGTVIIAKPEALTAAQLNNRASNPLLLMDSYTGVVGLTFYYPEQSIAQPVPYGYTVYSEAPRTAVLRDITMINSYRGVGVGTRLTSSHELFQNEGLHITALETGVEMYRSTEVGFTVDLTVSPKYWIDAGRGWACDDPEALRDFCRENTIGLIVQKLDDECLSTLRFDSCRTAIYAPRVQANQQDIWGTIYDVTVTDSMYGIVIEALSASTGLVIADVEIEASKKAVVNSSATGTLKLSGVTLTGAGKVHAEDGDIMYDEDTDLSEYEIVYGSYEKPAPYLYNAEIKDKASRRVDAAPAIQAVLDQAALTGGVVYLPTGVYSLYTPITVPAGVQLRGATPVFTRDATGAHPDGTLLLTYITDEAAIYLNANAGVNGLRIFCPVYDALTAQEALDSGAAEVETCIAIKGLGKGVYAYNVGITATMIGIDFTGCDDHLIKQTFGCAYKTFARVGGKNGVVTSCLNNPHFINRQSFAALGYLDEDHCNVDRQEAYSHGQDENTTVKSGFATLRDLVLRKHCTMIEVVDADHQTVSNVFMYAPYELISASNSLTFVYNTSADFVGFGSVYHAKNNSVVIVVNALRSVGDSVRCDDSSYLDLYNRVNTEIYYEGDYHSSDGVEDTFDFKVKKKVSLFPENQTTNVRFATLNTDKSYIKEGSYSHVHKPSGGTNENILQVNFNAVDISEYMNSNGYLHMWIYAEDMGTQTWGGNIELTSSGKADEQEIYWIPTSFITHNGWNEIWLPLGDIKGTGNFNAKKVNFLRVYNTNNYLGNQGEFYVDDIYVCLATSDKIRLPVEQTPVTEATIPKPLTQAVVPSGPEDGSVELEILPVLDCDSIIYVSTTVPVQLNYDPNYVKQGSASWKSDAGSRTNGEEIFCINTGLQGNLADISSYMKDGYLHFWLHIDGDYSFKSGQLEITSSATFDKQELNWNPVQFSELKRGWNEIVLPLADANVAEDFDPKKVKFMRLYMMTTDKDYGIYYVDDLYFFREKTVAPVGQEKRETLVIDNCDEVGRIGIPVEINYEPQYVKEGSGSYFSAGSKRSNGNELFLLRGEWNVSDYMENGYFHAWIYFTGNTDFKAVELEITSSGDCDKQELNWQIEHFKGLKRGWNEIVLPFADASAVWEDFDPSKANFIRMFTLSNDGTYGDYYIDDVYLYVEK